MEAAVQVKIHNRHVIGQAGSVGGCDALADDVPEGRAAREAWPIPALRGAHGTTREVG